jgi:hypothetical protein
MEASISLAATLLPAIEKVGRPLLVHVSRDPLVIWAQVVFGRFEGGRRRCGAPASTIPSPTRLHPAA